jgi:hypothetical protein
LQVLDLTFDTHQTSSIVVWVLQTLTVIIKTTQGVAKTPCPMVQSVFMFLSLHLKSTFPFNICFSSKLGFVNHIFIIRLLIPGFLNYHCSTFFTFCSKIGILCRSISWNHSTLNQSSFHWLILITDRPLHSLKMDKCFRSTCTFRGFLPRVWIRCLLKEECC